MASWPLRNQDSGVIFASGWLKVFVARRLRAEGYPEDAS